MKSTLKNMVIVLFSITLISSTAVALVYQFTLDPIAAADAKKLNDAISEVMPSFDTLSEDIIIESYDGGEPLKKYVGYTNGRVTGYAVETYTMKGYSGKISLLVGFTAEGYINKVAVLSHAETPGLGAKITDSASHFVLQFEGKNPATFNMSVTKDGGEVDAITASTITSRAYSDALTRAHSSLMRSISKNK